MQSHQLVETKQVRSDMDTHKGQEEEEEVNNMDLWSRQVIYEAQKEHFQIEYNFIEISRLPQRVNSKNLASLVMSTSQIMPKKIDICYKADDTDMKNPIALIECRSETDAHRIIEKLRISPYAKFWHIEAIRDPKFVNSTLAQ